MIRLKTLPTFFNAVYSGEKTFELRKNDRNFAIGDSLLLEEWASVGGYTGREMVMSVSYVLKDFPGLETGYVILGIKAPDSVCVK